MDVRFTPKTIVAALGIPHATINTWAHRGLLADMDAAETRKGKARSFTMSDCLALALLREAALRGIDVPELAGWASKAADAWLKQPLKIRELHIRYSPGADGQGESSIRYNDDVHEAPPPDDWIVMCSFNLSRLWFKAQNDLLARRLRDASGRTD